MQQHDNECTSRFVLLFLMQAIFVPFHAMNTSHFRLLVFILFCLIDASLSAQKGIQWGGEVFKPSSSTAFQVIGNWPDGVLMQARTRTKLFSTGKTYIQRFDNLTLLPQFNKEIKLETSKGSKSLEYAVLERVGNFPVLFATYFNKDRDKIELFGRQYDIEGEPLGKEKMIAEFPATRKSQLEALNFVQASDSSSMLTFFSERFDKYANEKMDFNLFDQELNIIWNRSIEFPYQNRNFEIHRTVVDPTGRVYLLIRVLFDKEERSQNAGPGFRYSLVTFGSDTSLVEDYEISLGDQYISDIDMILNANNQIICSGFYSERGRGQAAGTFFLNINRNKREVEQKGLSPFDKGFAASFMESSRIRGKIELTDFKLDHFVRFQDGSFGLVAEQFLVDEICFQDFRTGMFNCNYFYYYNNIIVVKMDSTGEVIWTADIPKYQESSNDGGFHSSYAFAFDGKNLHFVFNDHPRNLTETDQLRAHIMNNVRRSVPVYARISNDGQFSRRQVSSEKKQRLFFIPRYSAQISDRSIWLVGMTTNKYRAGVLLLD